MQVCPGRSRICSGRLTPSSPIPPPDRGLSVLSRLEKLAVWGAEGRNAGPSWSGKIRMHCLQALLRKVRPLWCRRQSSYAPAAVGARFEDLALAYLRRQRLALVARNYSCRMGELDLIMMEGEILVFVEVRYRCDRKFGGAVASITRHKMRNIVATAHRFLSERPEYRNFASRFDIVAMVGSECEPAGQSWQWIRGAFDSDADSMRWY